MCGSEESEIGLEIAEFGKIIANIWDLTANTKDVPALINKLQGLLSFEERHNLNWLQDNQLKSFYLYGKFIRERNTEQANLLLKALRDTGNAEIADRIIKSDRDVKETQTENKRGEEATERKTMAALIVGPDKTQPGNVKSPSIVSYIVNGKNKIYHTVDSLRISQSLAHKMSTLKLNDIHLSLSCLKESLKPCVSLEHLHLNNINLLTTCESPSASSEPNTRPNVENPIVTNDGNTAETNTVHFPHLKSYHFYSEHETSNTYSWNTIFFFSILGKAGSSDLLNFWRSHTKVDVKCQSMNIQLNSDEPSTVFISLPKKQFYNTPRFFPYIEKDSIRSFFLKCGHVKDFSCLLPSEFDKVNFNELPSCSCLHLSGLDISYTPEMKEEEKTTVAAPAKFYKDVHFEKCTLSKLFLDEISSVMPLARRIELKDCQLDSNFDGADINISIGGRQGVSRFESAI